MDSNTPASPTFASLKAVTFVSTICDHLSPLYNTASWESMLVTKITTIQCVTNICDDVRPKRSQFMRWRVGFRGWSCCAGSRTGRIEPEAGAEAAASWVGAVQTSSQNRNVGTASLQR